MLPVDEAFRKFKSRLELNAREQANASARQTEVRDYLDTNFKIDRSFLTGSYARWTKTKPLKDVDIFFVLKASEDHYHLVRMVKYWNNNPKHGEKPVKPSFRSNS